MNEIEGSLHSRTFSVNPNAMNTNLISVHDKFLLKLIKRGPNQEFLSKKRVRSGRRILRIAGANADRLSQR